MESITFSSLPVSPSRVSTGKSRDFQTNWGKQYQTNREQQHDESFQNTMMRLINRTSRQFHLQKSTIKDLLNHLKSNVGPERQRLLRQLVLNEQRLFSLKEISKKQHFTTAELRSLCNKLKMEKQKEQNILSQIIEKNLGTYTQIEQNEFRKHSLSKNLEQLADRNKQRMILAKSQQQINANELSKFKNSFNHSTQASKGAQKPEKYSVKNDLQLQTVKNFVQNAQIHGQQLKDCLSHRFQHLIRLKESKYDKETRLVLLDQQNSMLQNQIDRLADDMELAETNRKEASDEINEEEFKLNSIQMQNTELKARLEILQHSLNDQISQSKQKRQTIQDLQKQNDNAHFSSVQTQSYLSKLIALKLESEYLQTRLKQSLSK